MYKRQVLAAITNLSGYTAVFYPAVAAFFIGILYVIMTGKVQKGGRGENCAGW